MSSVKSCQLSVSYEGGFPIALVSKRNSTTWNINLHFEWYNFLRSDPCSIIGGWSYRSVTCFRTRFHNLCSFLQEFSDSFALLTKTSWNFALPWRGWGNKVSISKAVYKRKIKHSALCEVRELQSNKGFAWRKNRSCCHFHFSRKTTSFSTTF